jgi:Carboxypeptidase regulatory-like domain
MHFRHLAPIVLLLILGAFERTSACSCARPDPPCGEYGEASAIFLGRVVGSAQRKSAVDEKGNKTVYDVGRIRFLVQENFKGVTGYEVEIHSGTGGGDCGYWFLRNESYVVYAYQGSEDKKLYTNICTRTAHITQAKDDLEFLRGVGDTKPGGTLFGRLARYIGDREHGPVQEGPKMSGVRVAIKGAGQTFEAVTNEAGEYRISGLPAGDYDAFPQLPDNLGAIASRDTVDRFGSYSGHKTIALSDRSCGEMSFIVQFSGVVSGKVVDVNGEPAREVQVNLALADDPEKEWSAWTDEEGRYEFHMVQPGNYLLGFNLRWAPSKDDPFRRTYYPGVNEKSEAGLIAIGEGEKLKGYDMTLPPRLIEREVKVMVVWPDGRPAVGASVRVEMSEATSIGDSANPDEKGVAVIKLFDKYRYIMIASAELNNNKHVHADPIEVLVEKNMKQLKFVLNKPGYGYEKVDALKRKEPK